MRPQAYEPRFPPLVKKLRRGPQVILPKDVGAILAFTGVGKNSKCVDAGAGAGFLAISLGNVAKSVVSYEWRPDFAQLANENVKRSGLKNVKIRQADIFQGIKERDLDLVTLDLAESERAVPVAYRALKKGGFIVGYLPHAEQVQAFVKACKKQNFEEIFVLEAVIREYWAREQGFRPQNTGLWHTAFLTFARK